MGAPDAVVHDLGQLFAACDIIELGAVVEEGAPLWPTHPRTRIRQDITHATAGYYCQTLELAEHTATHVDAPAHIHSTMMDRTIDTFGAAALCAEAVVYPLRLLGLDAGDTAGAADILKLEEQMGDSAGAGDIALLDFGWQKHWKTGDGGRYFAVNAPGLDESAVRLLAERGIRALGSDTIACDTALKDGKGAKSYAHDVYCLPRGILLMESLANLSVLPARVFFIALPLKIRNGSGSPIRPIALVPRVTQY